MAYSQILQLVLIYLILFSVLSGGYFFTINNRGKGYLYFVSSKGNTFLQSLVVFLLCVFLIGLIVPSPIQLIQDQDWAHQLAGANQILKGEHPFIDFLATYGPLTFYTSALAQLLTGMRILGEMVLIILGFSIAYTVLFWLMWSISNDKFLSFTLLVISIVLIPRLYKYYIVLGPILTLFFVWRYLDRPVRTRFWSIGLAVVITGLFRPDFGIYMLLSVIAAVLLSRPEVAVKHKLLDLMYFGCVLLLFASPWLIWVSMRGGLSNYLYASTINAVNHGAGMSIQSALPKNILSWEFLQYVAGLTFNLLPGFSLIFVFYTKNNLDAKTRTKLLTTIVAAQFTLIQGLHRADWGHLLQAIPTTFVLLAYLIKQAFLYLSSSKRIFAIIGLGVGVSLLSVMIFFSFSTWKSVSIEKTWKNIVFYNLSRTQFTNRIIQKYPENNILQAMDFIQKCTASNEKIIAWPYLLDFYYFIDRPFGSPFMGLTPGFFNSERYQNQAVHELSKHEVRFFIYRPVTFTAEADTISDYAPIIASYLEKTYIPVQSYGNITIYVHRHKKNLPACTTN